MWYPSSIGNPNGVNCRMVDSVWVNRIRGNQHGRRRRWTAKRLAGRSGPARNADAAQPSRRHLSRAVVGRRHGERLLFRHKVTEGQGTRKTSSEARGGSGFNRHPDARSSWRRAPRHTAPASLPAGRRYVIDALLLQQHQGTLRNPSHHRHASRPRVQRSSVKPQQSLAPSPSPSRPARRCPYTGPEGRRLAVAQCIATGLQRCDLRQRRPWL
ncbi:hypothetical protein IWX90DRAFT_216459 [Phyllosticta citrichinensis]|uniref:Uncharacterized protein n=1 Tax=Phyllosticta citrichinensis TaxID=1130410 RepID=A0ABR1XTU4_9PEZI